MNAGLPPRHSGYRPARTPARRQSPPPPPPSGDGGGSPRAEHVPALPAALAEQDLDAVLARPHADHVPALVAEIRRLRAGWVLAVDPARDAHTMDEAAAAGHERAHHWPGDPEPPGPTSPEAHDG